jgi:hypothetical protein
LSKKQKQMLLNQVKAREEIWNVLANCCIFFLCRMRKINTAFTRLSIIDYQ